VRTGFFFQQPRTHHAASALRWSMSGACMKGVQAQVEATVHIIVGFVAKHSEKL
jgi:hypothetical protein